MRRDRQNKNPKNKSTSLRLKKFINRNFDSFTTAMFYSGFFLAIIVFFISNIDEYPFIDALIFPKRSRAMSALEKLTNGQELKNGERGFAEISDIVKAHISTLPENREKTQMIVDAKLLSITKERGRMIDSIQGTKLILSIPFVAQGQEGDIEDLDFEVIKKGVHTLENSLPKQWETLLFWLSIVLMLFSRFIENIKNKKPLFT